MTKKIESTTENWENGALGADEEFATKSPLTGAEVDEALAMQMISIRLDKPLIEMLKGIASVNGIGYQPLIRKVLHRFADAEAKKLALEYVKQQEKSDEGDDDRNGGDQKRCA